MRGGVPPRRHGSMLDLRLGEEGRRARHSYAAPHWEDCPPHLRGIMVGIIFYSIQYSPTS